MSSRIDPLAYTADESMDLHGIATWEPRSVVDRALAYYAWPAIRLLVVLLAVSMFLVTMVLTALQMLLDPPSLLALVLFPLSVFPALLIVGYVWYTDVTREPWLYLLITFVLGIVLSVFPLVTNTAAAFVLAPAFEVPVLGFLVEAAYHFLVVAPMEEAVKIGAVVAFVYWTTDFDTVIDGAVYGAVAGLGFATIENFFYILQVMLEFEDPLAGLIGGGIVTVLRSIVGPGHVIWTALAGYYLGLAKFNPEYKLALISKGLLLVIVLHATYNTLVSAIPRVLAALNLELLSILLVPGFIVLYHGAVFAYLFVLLRRYRLAYAEVSPGPEAAPVSDLDDYQAAIEEHDAEE